MMRSVDFTMLLHRPTLRPTLLDSVVGVCGMVVGLASSTPVLAQTLDSPEAVINYPAAEQYNIIVNSSEDGPALADSGLTLREAIELTNGTLRYEDLSVQEQQQVSPVSSSSVIGFNLPEGASEIALLTPLPDILQPGLTIDGTTQPGYDATVSATAEIIIPVPIVELTVAQNAEVIRGLTIVTDDVVVRGLSIYGFTTDHNSTATTPPADIFIAHRLPPPDISEQAVPARFFSFSDDNVPPQGIVLEQNWLGIPPTETLPERPSAFGISIFNAQGVTIRRNRISYHDGSGIITGVRAENTDIVDNIVVNNGLRGIPDAIRLEGRIDNTRITNNLLCGNDGSGIFLFKPEGAVDINGNDIRFNGQRLRRAAVYLMGNDHRVFDNTISDQKGPGVVVTAFSQGSVTHSQRNQILNNRFSRLEGLSIDLNTRRNVREQDFQRGDGPNPLRNSSRRRWETGNSAINAPQFLSSEFYRINDEVVIQGQADPGSEVQLYLTTGQAEAYGPLTQPLATIPVDDAGNFSYRTRDLAPGRQVSAISTDPRYGTSEPALNAVILALGEAATTAAIAPAGEFSCTPTLRAVGMPPPDPSDEVR